MTVSAGCPKTMGRLFSDSPSGLSGVTPGERLSFESSPRDGLCATTQHPSRTTRLVGTLRRLSMSTSHAVAQNLAAALLSGPWSRRPMLLRARATCGGRPRWLGMLVGKIFKVFSEPPAWHPCEILTDFIKADVLFRNAYGPGKHLPVLRWYWLPAAMKPRPGKPAAWPIPAWTDPAALADWLHLRPTELDWFADCQGHEARVPEGPLRHYHYRRLPKIGGRWRLLEIPKSRLNALQRRLLHELLDFIPPHEAAHGYRRARSIATFARPHCGRRMVLRFDLRHFFASVPATRVHALFRTAGYPTAVARLLTGLCTNVVPPETWLPADNSAFPQQDRERYRVPHLPQGAPTSPALANLCAYRLDCRLQRLATAVGASYTRYADDLAFSGDDELERSARRFQVAVCRIALEEGFEIHTRKSRFMRRGVRQQLVGVVLNRHLNVRRDEYDRLKAILHNCARHGPAGQNRDGLADFRAHLLGRIGHVAMLNPARGQRLRDWFQRVRWEEG
jgi:RNA-directed DNA polymerase